MSYMLGIPPKIATRGMEDIVRPTRPSEEATVTICTSLIYPFRRPRVLSSRPVTSTYVNGTLLTDHSALGLCSSDATHNAHWYSASDNPARGGNKSGWAAKKLSIIPGQAFLPSQFTATTSPDRPSRPEHPDVIPTHRHSPVTHSTSQQTASSDLGPIDVA